MTRVDFHSNVPDKLAYASRLVRKAYMAGNKVVVLTADSEQLAALDAAMWTISPTDFLPHVAAGDPLAVHTPIVLTDNMDVELPHHDILVNLSQLPPVNYAQFQRVFEIVAMDEHDAQAGRQRFLHYRKAGMEPTHFVAGKT
ncbi:MULTISPECIES: DNA polymerase III subunit chi [unclassified Janthinobacterium]|jgi:DNA polymerase III subunit chi|uniref:DNA polymerase III subunit chi n=1 Tax=unclassified Janthinobacterium TaxID=2610881 RepID=UPI001609FB1A|nr:MULTISPECIES: DNA polymerase III subunit chi [unclassified Janthinobacterium]MBB5607904.1 DNA polymerase-3 subunit chi [Janthinobacterium sp. S3T4]MBB5613355.1 DNA polymerase-3 subunit chi [Janthinobacterium sp. S3M3]